MSKVDYDQVARFEAASELLTVFMGMCRNLKKEYSEYEEDLDKKCLDTLRVKQKLRTEDDKMVKDVVDTYGLITREYYKNPKDFKLTKSFFEIKASYEDWP